MALLETRFYSNTLEVSVGANILLPDRSDAWQEPPSVLYLLHGLSGDHTSWCRSSSIERYAREYNLAVIMPDAYKSFYCDMKHGSNYLAFFTEELPALITRWFKVSAERKHTFIAGSSMGGYGAMKLALESPALFGAAASLSGALDISAHIDDDWSDSQLRTFKAALGDLRTVANTENDLIGQLKSIDKASDMPLYIACGTEDYLYQDSITFRDQALQLGFNVTYEERSGEHHWDYWDVQIQRLLEWLPIEKIVKEDQ